MPLSFMGITNYINSSLIKTNDIKLHLQTKKKNIWPLYIRRHQEPKLQTHCSVIHDNTKLKTNKKKEKKMCPALCVQCVLLQIVIQDPKILLYQKLNKPSVECGCSEGNVVDFFMNIDNLCNKYYYVYYTLIIY